MGERLRQLSAMDEAVRRIEEQLGEARTGKAQLDADLQGLADTSELKERLAALRTGVDRDRADYAEERARHDGIEREARLRCRTAESHRGRAAAMEGTLGQGDDTG